MSHAHQWVATQVLYRCLMCSEHVKEPVCPQCGSRSNPDVQEWECTVPGCNAHHNGAHGRGPPPPQSQSQSMDPIDLDQFNG